MGEGDQLYSTNMAAVPSEARFLSFISLYLRCLFLSRLTPNCYSYVYCPLQTRRHPQPPYPQAVSSNAVRNPPSGCEGTTVPELWLQGEWTCRLQGTARRVVLQANSTTESCLVLAVEGRIVTPYGGFMDWSFPSPR